MADSRDLTICEGMRDNYMFCTVSFAGGLE